MIINAYLVRLTMFFPQNSDNRFNGALSHELSNDHPNMLIIHRKVALVLGHWVSEVINVLGNFDICWDSFSNVHPEELQLKLCGPLS